MMAGDMVDLRESLAGMILMDSLHWKMIEFVTMECMRTSMVFVEVLEEAEEDLLTFLELVTVLDMDTKDGSLLFVLCM